MSAVTKLLGLVFSLLVAVIGFADWQRFAASENTTKLAPQTIAAVDPKPATSAEDTQEI